MEIIGNEFREYLREIFFFFPAKNLYVRKTDFEIIILSEC